MRKISIIGHFGFGRNCLNGQTIKTKIVSNELIRLFGKEEVALHDSHGGVSFLLKLPFVALKMMVRSHNIIMLPGKKGLLFISPLLLVLNMMFRRKMFYVVIGGWLPDTVSKNGLLRFVLKSFDSIFVETKSMKEKMSEMGFHNVVIMPNCKKLDIVSMDDTVEFQHPFSLCTFSRVIKEKGIEDAIEAVKTCNAAAGYTVFSLDIYGQVGDDYRQRFENIIQNLPDYIKYRGCVDYTESTNVLKKYFALLFPTYYEGECFAGTVIDAFSAGLPVIASDWHDNGNIITDKRTGFIFPVHSIAALTKILSEISDNPSLIKDMRLACLQEAKKYQPENVISTLAAVFE